MCYKGESLHPEGYSNAIWAGDLDGGLNLANLMTPSSIESEYVVCAATIRKVVWLKRFLKAYRHKWYGYHCDSEVVIAYTLDPKDHKRLNI